MDSYVKAGSVANCFDTKRMLVQIDADSLSAKQ